MKPPTVDMKLSSEVCTLYHDSMQRVLFVLLTSTNQEFKVLRVNTCGVLPDIIVRDVETA